MSRADLAVVGAGVIGLAVAWKAAAAGHHVTVFDPEPACGGASWVAGGMLAPVAEAWPGEEVALALGEESLRRWPRFARELRSEGFDCGLSEQGTIIAAFDHADAEQLDILERYLAGIGRQATLVTGRRLRRTEPGLGAVRSGLLVPSDVFVDNRRLLKALLEAARSRGAEFVCETAVRLDGHSVATASRTRRFDAVVLAAGAYSGRLHPELETSVHPLKGEVLRLRARRGTLPPPRHTVRAVSEGRPVYLVPRDDGELVLGATQYEAGFDTTVTARGVRELIEAAERVFPSVAEYELIETAAGLRAGSSDNVPYLGPLHDGVYAATGHHRNGLLLAPVTADAVLAWLSGTRPPEGTERARPDRDTSEEHADASVRQR
ncbi:glycine oxidase ThiO [Saccharomonospora sp.]|uniref:glycine oxidase ThiO n=1 Tax=Saccharomonospora sp. TaxID=33913 RepID=UPI0026311B65|nr:glycine oxidase ThiO [Saccharomonospora sp.]